MIFYENNRPIKLNTPSFQSPQRPQKNPRPLSLQSSQRAQRSLSPQRNQKKIQSAHNSQASHKSQAFQASHFSQKSPCGRFICAGDFLCTILLQNDGISTFLQPCNNPVTICGKLYPLYINALRIFFKKISKYTYFNTKNLPRAGESVTLHRRTTKTPTFSS